MNKTLKISFSLKNTYRVNNILYALKQIPLLKKILPDALYGVLGFKVLANIISVFIEIGTTFIGKFLYFLIIMWSISILHPDIAIIDTRNIFLHILLFLSIVGSFVNTYMFNPTKDKYYAMMILRMNAREYTLINYFYAIIKLIVGFLPFTIILGLYIKIPLWICLLIPFFIAGLKLTVAVIYIKRYEKTGNASNENALGKLYWIVILVLIACAFALPIIKFIIPLEIIVGIMFLAVVSGLISLRKILSFKDYRDMYQQILTKSMQQIDELKTKVKQDTHKAISVNTTIASDKKGFAYLNELFIKRHQKILWKSTKIISLVSLLLIVALLFLFFLRPETKTTANETFLNFLPYFVFIMYMLNRGTKFTTALFMNCDHSLLTYSFYKKPDFMLKLFQIRLKEIIKINLLPATIIGLGLAILLYASGGTNTPLNYVILVVSIMCMSVFFSVHYLTIYYLLQPYNIATETKSPTYNIVLTLTYAVCYCIMKVQLSTFYFGIACIVFCVLYCIVSSILVYKLAPKTFKLRN